MHIKPEWKAYIRIAVVAFGLFLCIHYWPAVSNLLATLLSAARPILFGCIFAYPLNILMSFYERHYFPHSANKLVRGSRRPVCLIGAIITLLAIIILVLALVLPQLASCITLVFSELPGAIDHFIKLLEKINIVPQDIPAMLSAIDWQSKIGEIAKTLTAGVDSVMTIVVNAASSLVSGVSTALLGVIFAIYLLAGKERLGRQCSRFLKHYLHETWYSKITYVLSVLDDCFHRFIVGQCAEAVILGLLCMIGMMILGLPYAAMVGALIAFTALIPIVGAFIGAGIGAFVILMESPIQAVIFLIFIIILQQLEGNLIYPRVVGSSIGLPGIWVLAAVTIGGSVLGVGGMLLGVPLTAAIYRLIRNNMNKGITPPEAPT